MPAGHRQHLWLQHPELLPCWTLLLAPCCGCAARQLLLLKWVHPLPRAVLPQLLRLFGVAAGVLYWAGP
jgi:hypothetical protein